MKSSAITSQTYRVFKGALSRKPISSKSALLLCLLVAILCSACSNDDEPIFEGDIVLLNQAEVDAFGKKGITHISGTLTIGKLHDPEELVKDLISLKGLASLVEVEGELAILGTYELTNLEGLEGLERIGGGLSIRFNRKLQSISQLSSLSQVNGKLTVANNNLLTSLEGFDNISGVQNLEIESNTGLEELFNMSNIQTLARVKIKGNTALTSIREFSNTSISHLHLRANPRISNLLGLESTTDLDTLILQDLILITGLEGLENLKTVSSSMVIRNNHELSDLSAMGYLEVGPEYLDVTANRRLTSIDRFRVRSETGRAIVTIHGNWELRGIEPLQGLESIEGLSLIGAKLQNLEDLSTLTNARYLTIAVVDRLESLQGLEQLLSLDQLSISENPNLLNIDALSNLTSVKEYFAIKRNTNLVDLCGIRPLLSSGGLTSDYEVFDNAFNPSEEDINAGNCQN